METTDLEVRSFSIRYTLHCMVVVPCVLCASMVSRGVDETSYGHLFWRTCMLKPRGRCNLYVSHF